MATKWNEFLYKPLTKILAFLLALVMAMGCTFLVMQMAFQLDGNVSDLFAQSFTQSDAFLRSAAQTVNYAVQMTRLYLSEEAMKDGSAFAPEKQVLLEEMERNIADEIKSCKANLQNYAENYWLFESDYFYTMDDSGNYSVDEAKIREVYTTQTQQQIASYQAQFHREYQQAKKHLDSVNALHYAVVDRSTGSLCTNIPGEDYKAAVTALPWNSYIINTQTETDYSTPASRYGSGGYDYFYWLEYPEDNLEIYVGFDSAELSDEADPLVRQALAFQRFTKTRLRLLGAVALLFVLCCALAVYLIVTAGRREKGGPIHLGKTDRLWNFFHWSVGIFGGAALALLFASLGANLFHSNSSLSRETLIPILCAVGVAPVLCLWGESVLSIARHAKNRTLLKNTLWHRLYQSVRESQRHRSMKRSTALILLGFAAWNALTAFLAVAFSDWGAFLLIITPMLLAGALGSYFLLQRHLTALDNIRVAVAQVKQGNLTPSLDSTGMPAGMQGLAEGILEMQQGMQAAVRQAVAGERMRTELITNVSHDLKTPLTSVINYVDLLSRGDLSEEERGDYLLTLAQKSEQLGRLIEDLIEASKASSGNVDLNPVEVNLHELALQAMGETGDALAAQNIEVILQPAAEPPVVWADSQKTWRIIENLMNNVTKYAMPGTRVYLQLDWAEGFGGIIIKNISRAALSLPAEELSQRFVRGDAARGGQGNGLGLSIAESLCRLQGGKFELQVDGDLFKAGVWLPLSGAMH